MTPPLSKRKERVRGRPAIRQAQVLNYVQSIFADHGHPPSYGMICTALGINSRQEVHRIIARLEGVGLLSRIGEGKVRRIRLT
jgi:SOS-response transcriptional repressor LexA